MSYCVNCSYKPAPFGLDRNYDYEIPKDGRITLCLDCFKKLTNMKEGKRNQVIKALVQRVKNVETNL